MKSPNFFWLLFFVCCPVFALAGEEYQDDFHEYQFEARPTPDWVRMVDQGGEKSGFQWNQDAGWGEGGTACV